MNRPGLFFTLSLFIFLSACQQKKDSSEVISSKGIALDSATFVSQDEEMVAAYQMKAKIEKAVFANAETFAMSANKDDVADDPAIWVHPNDPAKSTIIGTNKFNGIHVYDLSGKELYYYEVGITNNIDIRYGVSGTDLAITGCTNRTYNGLTFMAINDSTGALSLLKHNINSIDTTIMDEVYGFCFYQDLQKDSLYAIVNAKNGRIQQYVMEVAGPDSLHLTLVRTLQVPTQPEGMVADEELNRLYVGEEDKGVWRFEASSNGHSGGSLIFDVNDEENVAADVEGLCLYYAADTTGYLIGSSQGNYTYFVLDRQSNAYLGSFKISGKNSIDGTEDTDGIEVINKPLGKSFPNGLFVVQDGFNFDDGKHNAQNFKLVDWKEIAEVLQLTIDTTYQVIQ